MHMTASDNRPKTTSKSESGEVVGSLVLRPGEGKELFLGVYEKTLPKPAFDVMFEPNMPDDIKRFLLETEKDGDRLFAYYFQNFSGQTCKITVVEKDD